MKERLRVGIIGFGLSGRVFHAPIIDSLENFELAKIVSNRHSTIEIVRTKYPRAEVVSNPELVLGDNSIDLIIVATPNTSHFEYASKALLANKHVVVEKPFTVTSKEADELIELANKQSRILTVYQNRRWDSDFLTVKKIVDSELLGNIVECEIHFDRFRNTIRENSWREESYPGSGILYDLGSHLIDQALCLFGTPKEVMGDIKIQRQGGKIDDYFETTFWYEKFKVILKAGMLVREPLPHFIIMGDRGSFMKHGMDTQEEALKKGYSPKDLDDWGKEPESLWGTLNTEIGGLHFRGKVESSIGDYRSFYRNLHEAIKGTATLEVKPEEGRNTIKIIELAIESSKQKCILQF